VYISSPLVCLSDDLGEIKSAREIIHQLHNNFDDTGIFLNEYKQKIREDFFVEPNPEKLGAKYIVKFYAAIKNAGLPTVVIEPGLQGAMNAHRKGLNPVICSSLEDAGFKTHLIPAVGLFDILEHIEDDIGFLTTIKTLLVPNGKLYITVPAYNFLRSVEDNYAGHYRRYTLKEPVLFQNCWRKHFFFCRSRIQ